MSAMQRTKRQAGEREFASLVRDLTVHRAGDLLPEMFYRVDRADWRAVWPLAVALVQQRAECWRRYERTAETSVEAWATVARDGSVSHPATALRTTRRATRDYP